MPDPSDEVTEAMRAQVDALGEEIAHLRAFDRMDAKEMSGGDAERCRLARGRDDLRNRRQRRPQATVFTRSAFRHGAKAIRS